MYVKLKNASVYESGRFKTVPEFSVLVSAEAPESSSDFLFSLADCHIFPGFADVHVHLREPGFSYKETIASGTAAAAHGGYTDVCTMPNLNPAPDCMSNLLVQLELIEESAVVRVHPYGTITKGQLGETLSDMESIREHVCAFSDDGRGVQCSEIMLEAMWRAKRLGKLIAAHCEDNSLLNGGYINMGEYARSHGHAGICAESEWRQIERDIRLARETGCAYHVCHISTAKSVELIRQAKAVGVDISCETAPHYLVFNDSMLRDEGRFKMNPPIRSEVDRLALIEGCLDGTIDMIATDHAPHSAEEKAGGLRGSAMGVIGLETAFPALYASLAAHGIIPLERILEMLCVNPRRRFGLPALDMERDFSVWDLSEEYEFNEALYLSKGKASPFTGTVGRGRCLLTVCGGRAVWIDREYLLRHAVKQD